MEHQYKPAARNCRRRTQSHDRARLCAWNHYGGHLYANSTALGGRGDSPKGRMAVVAMTEAWSKDGGGAARLLCADGSRTASGDQAVARGQRLIARSSLTTRRWHVVGGGWRWRELEAAVVSLVRGGANRGAAMLFISERERGRCGERNTGTWLIVLSSANGRVRREDGSVAVAVLVHGRATRGKGLPARAYGSAIAGHGRGRGRERGGEEMRERRASGGRRAGAPCWRKEKGEEGDARAAAMADTWHEGTAQATSHNARAQPRAETERMVSGPWRRACSPARGRRKRLNGPRSWAAQGKRKRSRPTWNLKEKRKRELVGIFGIIQFGILNWD